MKQHTKILWLLFITGCSGIMSSDDVCQTPICHQTALNLLQAIDSSVDPCKNFYGYACANFVRRNPLPSDAVKYGQSNKLIYQIQNQIQEILSSSDEVVNISKPLAKAIAAYNACLATNESISELLDVIVHELGGSPLINNGSWSSNDYDITSALTSSLLYGNSPLFKVSVEVDQKNTSTQILYIDQPEMQLDVDYYLERGNYRSVWQTYLEFIVNSTIALAGNVTDDVEETAQEIFDFEAAIVNISSTFVEKQDSTRRYNRMTIGQLQNLTDPNFKMINWTEFLRNLVDIDDVSEEEPIIVHEPSYMSQLFTILNNTHINLLANYISWSFIHYISDQAIGQQEQLLYQFRIQAGIGKKSPEREEKCVESLSEIWYHAIAQLYVSQFTDESTRSHAEDMLKLLQKSFIDRLDLNPLMDNATKLVAIEKARAMHFLVGYPDWINDTEEVESYYKDYPNITDHHLTNHLTMAKTLLKTSFSGLRDPLDRQSFDQSPMIVNAYYSPTRNAILLPIGILNPPLYFNGAPSATNFGGMGSTVGHEITHGFDSDGRKYDQKGNLQSWWPQSVVDRFEVKSKCFIRQYSKCCPLVHAATNEPLYCVDGQQTLGENIADNGGLEAAYQAWGEWTAEHGEDLELPGMENYTSAQIFFLSYANLWCTTASVGSLFHDLSNDEHSPNSCRVNGAVANSPEFSTAFNCSRGAMNRGRNRCSIW